MPSSRFVSFHLGCLFVVFVYGFLTHVSCKLRLVETHYEPKDDLDLFVFLPVSPKCWNHVDKPLQPVSALACFEDWALYVAQVGLEFIKCPWLVSSL